MDRGLASPLGTTDRSRWRLDSGDSGRHVWHYVRLAGEDGSVPAYEDVWGEDERGVKERGEQTDEEKYWLGSRLESDGQDDVSPATPMDAARRGYEFYQRLQAPDGHWSGEYGGESNEVVLLEGWVLIVLWSGPLFLMPGVVIAMFVTGTPIPEEWRIEMSRYLVNAQRQGGEGDQGWGL